MNGFEFLSVVRQAVSFHPGHRDLWRVHRYQRTGKCVGGRLFSERRHQPEHLFAKIEQFLVELPTRPRVGKPPKAAIWVKNSGVIVAVTCTDCLRTFPVTSATEGINEVPCDFCPAVIRFEVIEGSPDAEALVSRSILSGS